MMNAQRHAVLFAVLWASTLLAPTGTALAQRNPPPSHTTAMKFSRAAETWAEIVADRKTLGDVIAAGKLSEAHDLAFAIRDNVVTLPYKSSALPAAKQNLLAAQVQAVAAIAENMDRSGDAGNVAKTKAEYQRLLKALAAISALYPANSLPTFGARALSAQERALFLTPGGAYTAADIQANGNTSVDQKFPGYVASHETRVKTGAPVCPISETQHDPKLTWVIGGKTYRFCCPPCVAEFVKKAKTSPAAIKAPEAYVKK